ncbi:dihydrolipoyl dehydrogenase [Chitinophaga pendula]|uniref:dihydrolipoyl dehydrogenase n=1 Tax=Chitinophaga TaxID=79328 RepID=UPI000BAFB3E6|nr:MULTISPECIES: dihydrolipoyl dehydrogenase [Chitinophaga]ASZ14063.1 dihydrolipoyl dehydrogenase [Chitinophaga sp. MD30]UCJ08306.1 dihydrolipoyl dehydrogenase [Chitinophaga pendula]
MNYDVIVIGSGPGGYPAAIRASQLGLRVAIVEKENLGGICLNWGCIPTKALLKSAQVADYGRHGSAYGLNFGEVGVDFPAVIQRSREVANKKSKGVQYLMKKNKIDVIMGYGRLKAPGQVEVTSADGNKLTFQGKYMVLATGGRARQLPNLPIDGKHIIGYREAMSLPQQPKSMIVVGSGAIGSEFAYFYNTLGTKVTLVEFMPRIVPVEDEEVSKELEKQFKKQGITVMMGASVEKAEPGPNGVTAAIKLADGSMVTLDADIVLSAVGIVANIEDLGLEQLGVKTEKGRILVDEHLKTTAPRIYALGDCVPNQALAHKATKEGVLAAEHIAYTEKKLPKEPRRLDYGNVPGCTFCIPEIASVGLTEKAAKEAGYEIKVGKFPLSANGKASAAGSPEGFVKVIFDAKYGELLGCHMIGNGVTEMIAEAVLARTLESTAQEILQAIHPHPTMSEAFKEATALAYDEAIDI